MKDQKKIDKAIKRANKKLARIKKKYPDEPMMETVEDIVSQVSEKFGSNNTNENVISLSDRITKFTNLFLKK